MIYVIQQGDTLSEIIEEYNINLDKLKKANNISNIANIKMGDELIIPLTNEQTNKLNSSDKLFSQYTNKKKNFLLLSILIMQLE